MHKKFSVTKNSFTDIVVHFIPAIIITALFQVLAIIIYKNNPINNSKINFFIWTVSQAFGSFILGYISDHYCRKKTLIYTQIFGLVAIIGFAFFGYNNWFVILFTGLTFSPSAIAKAALVDNFPHVSKVRIVGITFLALLLPWCFFIKIVKANPLTIFIFMTLVLIINLILSLPFEDRRDRSTHHNEKNILFISKYRFKIFYTVLALIPAQAVFFLSDSFFEESSTSAPLFTMLGIGVFIGAAVSIFYSKIPDISVITICYGFGFIFCLEALITTFVIPLPNGILPIMILLFSTGGGFYLPFVYDALLSSVSSNFRGATCGIIEAIISLSGIIGLGIILIFNPNEKTILSLMTIFFLTATILQKKGETA